MIQLKRVYEEKATHDGLRILVERLWPRGLRKEQAEIDVWMKDLAPSQELRKWFGHDPAKWDEFRRRYRRELDEKGELLERLKSHVREGTVTFVYAARDQQHNSAVALKEYLERTSS